MITPEEAKKRMLSILEIKDIEMAHLEADDLLIEILKGIGYSEATEIWERIDKWYA